MISRKEPEDEMIKTILYTSLFVLLLVVAVWLAVFEVGSHVSRRGIRDLQITTDSSRYPATVSIDGTLISSSSAVGSVKQRREGRCVVVLVREVLVRRGRTWGKFHLDVAITDDIDEIAFDESHEVIWHR